MEIWQSAYESSVADWTKASEKQVGDFVALGSLEGRRLPLLMEVDFR
jgi:hypothetical protein